MLFPSFTFLIFFLLVVGVIALVDEQTRTRKVVLLIASYGFYMWWNPAFILLIAASTVIDFTIGRKMAATEAAGLRKTLLWVSIAANLGVLAFFKYANFFQDNLLWALKLAGHDPGWTALNVILPVGISFYTFQTMSYTIDVYRRSLPASRSPLDFALFVSFFPQLVAGPIVRAADFLPQLEIKTRLRFRRESFFLFLRGLVKKVIIADNVAVFADFVFTDPDGSTSAVIWLATIAFYVQIYCDFSGYSDMAIAVADVLGFDLPLNFDRPYFAKDPSEFWRKWHISLSSWLRDYLYIPLGGNRGSELFTLRNLMLTMLLGGLWHGASWSFVLWGILHGIALIAHRMWRPFRAKRFPNAAESTLYGFGAWALMQWWVLLTWIPFRVLDGEKMLYSVRKFLIPDGSLSLVNQGLGRASLISTLLILAAFWIVHWYSERRGGLDVRLARARLPVAAGACVVAGILLFLFWPTTEAPFIYFQF